MTARASQRTGGFAPSLTSLIGRDEDVATTIRLLERHRLVTVTGPGGVGKTRVAAEVTERLAESSTGPVWVVELAAIEDPGQVPSVVADCLGCRPGPDRSTMEAITAVLAGEAGTLVLDNCEHLVDGVLELCTALLAGSDDVRILTTSREPLGVAGEARLRLRPLETRGLEPTGQVADGVRLFADRARLVDSRFRVTADNAPTVTTIVSRLDGLPLAIELAAARCESLGLAGLLDQLDEPLSVLTSGPRRAPARHRSLRATVDWSHRLLSPGQQKVLQQLSVLPGAFTLDAAAAVAGSQARDVVPDLVECSLLAPPAESEDGRLRYLMPEAVAAFAREQLVALDLDRETRAAMADHAMSVAESASASIRQAGQEATAAVWCDLEGPLLRQSLTWATLHDPPVALRTARALASWFQLRGRAETGYQLLRDAVEQCPDHDDGWLAAHIWLGRLAHSIADWPTALHHFDTACAASAGAATTLLADALSGRSGTHRNQSRLSAATADAEQALELSRQLDYAEGRAYALVQLSLAASYDGDHHAATRWAEQAATVDPELLPDRVTRRVGIAMTMARAEAGQLELAGRSCAAGLASARHAGDVDMEADFLYLTTHLALQSERYDEAGGPIREAVRLSLRSGDRLRLLDCLDDCAHLCAATGRPADAVTLWVARVALGQPDNMPDPGRAPDVRDHRMREARATLAPDDAEAAERRGHRLSLATAAELAVLMADAAPRPREGTRAADGLTPREQELLTLVAGGRTDAQIAAELFISIRTVRSHLDRIRDKTGSRRRADLTRLALQLGLV
ncbi:MAG: LuxR C-terminal-related transcriptional regulator [Nocardioides sp.]